MNSFSSTLEVLAVAGSLFAVYDAWRKRQAFLREHPPVAYQADQTIAGWRWSPPPPAVALRREERGPVSRIHLPAGSRTANAVGSVLGYLMALGGFLLVFGVMFLPGDESLACGRFAAGLALIAGGRGMLELDSRLVAIDLEQDRAVFVVRYGIFLFHHLAIRRRPWISVTGKVQSFLESQDAECPPAYILVLHRRIFPKHYLTCCDPAQGSWLVGGLAHWKAFHP